MVLLILLPPLCVEFVLLSSDILFMVIAIKAPFPSCDFRSLYKSFRFDSSFSLTFRLACFIFLSLFTPLCNWNRSLLYPSIFHSFLTHSSYLSFIFCLPSIYTNFRIFCFNFLISVIFILFFSTALCILFHSHMFFFFFYCKILVLFSFCFLAVSFLWDIYSCTKLFFFFYFYLYGFYFFLILFQFNQFYSLLL